MNQDTGQFIPLPDDLRKASDIKAECVKARLELNPQGASPEVKPVLYAGEVVQIKGVLFRVVKMKLDGRLTLKMLNRAEIMDGINALTLIAGEKEK